VIREVKNEFYTATAPKSNPGHERKQLNLRFQILRQQERTKPERPSTTTMATAGLTLRANQNRVAGTGARWTYKQGEGQSYPNSHGNMTMRLLNSSLKVFVGFVAQIFNCGVKLLFRH